jgi:hypothetical protein
MDTALIHRLAREAEPEGMTEEQYCRFMLAELQRAYQRDAKPYIDRLVRIESLRPQPRLILPIDHPAVEAIRTRFANPKG